MLSVGGDIWEVERPASGPSLSLDFFASSGDEPAGPDFTVAVERVAAPGAPQPEGREVFSNDRWFARRDGDGTTGFAWRNGNAVQLRVSGDRRRARLLLPEVIPGVAPDGKLSGVPGQAAVVTPYPFDQMLCIDRLAAAARGILVHSACAIARPGAVLFVGSSGAGKSTICGPLAGHPELRLLTDDRSVLFFREGRAHASGTPWAGSAEVARPGDAPLAAVFFLRHAAANGLEPVPPASAAAELFRTCFPPFWHRPGMEFALETCIRVAREVPCRVFSFRPDASAADFLLSEFSKEASRC